MKNIRFLCLTVALLFAGSVLAQRDIVIATDSNGEHFDAQRGFKQFSLHHDAWCLTG